jgi:LysR family transcriptional activator of nhaA
MNLKHLYYFWKVAKRGGVMRAAEAIHISPQTLSGQIKLLEARLGISLFQRLGR